VNSPGRWLAVLFVVAVAIGMAGGYWLFNSF
jgi:hypothetical protein